MFLSLINLHYVYNFCTFVLQLINQKGVMFQVTCVTEIPAEWPGGYSLLAIGCEEGTLYIYHTGASRILRAIQFNENVSYV